MGMFNSAATTIPAAAGYEVVSVEATGDVGRWPIIGSIIGYDDGGYILPIALGILFNGEAHAIAMPDGRVLTTAGSSPRWFKDAKAWSSAANEAMASRAWHAAGVPTAGEA